MPTLHPPGPTGRKESTWNADAIKVSAKQLAMLRMPADESAWALGAEAARIANRSNNDAATREALIEMSIHMSTAYGTDDELRTWWMSIAGLA